jgi:hypothetical protein
VILGVYRCFRRAYRLVDNLHWYHHVMVFITILVPLIWSLIITVLLTDWVSLRGGLHLVAFIVFLVVAELAVAFALTRDKFNAEGFVSHEVGVVSGEVRTLREQHDDLLGQHEDLIEKLRQQVDYHDEVIRSAFQESGRDLPGRRISVSPDPVSWEIVVPAASGTLTLGRSKRARLLRLLRRCRRWLKDMIWGK